MTPPLHRWYVRRWALGFLAMLAWIVISVGWSWLLINRTFEREIQSRLVSRTQQLARLAREQIQPTSLASTHPAADLENQSDLQADVDTAHRTEFNIAYAMIWTEDGKVIAHSRPELRLIHLDSTLWPGLEGHQSFRVSRLTVPDLSKDPHVLEATVPVQILSHTVAYASIAYAQEWIDEEFWRSQQQVLLGAGVFTVAGLVALFLFSHFTIARLDRRRRQVQQTARAHTSLLTERGMLASVLAHEVRSPLTALRFNLHSLRTIIASQAQGGAGQSLGSGSAPSDRQLELTDRCEREIRRLDGMLNDFLQRTQVIGPGGGVESASVNTVISEAIEFLRPALERKNIRISIHLDPSNPLVNAHPDELRQVILNLATNAHEAMPKGGTFAVSTVAEGFPPVEPASADSLPGSRPHNAADDGAVTILIRDSGAGIPPELHERIFEPFFSTKPNGSGLGLALVRRVVSGAGGTIACESVVAKSGGGSAASGDSGTTFRIVLPRALADAQRPILPGQGYAHVRRDDPALDLDSSPEIVIDQQESPKSEQSTDSTS